MLPGFALAPIRMAPQPWPAHTRSPSHSPAEQASEESPPTRKPKPGPKAKRKGDFFLTAAEKRSRAQHEAEAARAEAGRAALQELQQHKLRAAQARPPLEGVHMCDVV